MRRKERVPVRPAGHVLSVATMDIRSGADRIRS